MRFKHIIFIKKNTVTLTSHTILLVPAIILPMQFFFIEYTNVFLIFLQTKLFQNFVKLITKIITYLYCCSFDLRTHVGKNITRENSVGLLSLFEWNNFKFSLSFYFVKNPIFFVFSACMRLILLPCRKLFSQKRQIVCVVHITLSEEKTCLSQYIV